MRRICIVVTALLLVVSLGMNVAAADIEEVIIQACQREKPVNLDDYPISVEDFDALYLRLECEGKIPWYVYRYSISNYQGKVNTFTPRSLDPETYDRVAYELAVAEVLHDVIRPEMTQLQMALAVHDYLITHCAYDESLEKNTSYDLLINNSTVCVGYSKMYMEILTRLGIPCVCVVSYPMEHMWNLVQLEGSWYHVDLTWDDPVKDIQGQAQHTYFLLSDDQISEGDNPHYDWQTDIVCDSERYADAFWRDVNTPILHVDADTYVLRKDKKFVGSIYTYRESTDELTKLVSNKSQYVNVGRGQYAYGHTGLSLWNGRLYFNDMDTVYSTDLQGKDRREEYAHKTWREKSFIIGSFVENDVLYVSLSDHSFQNVTVKEVALAPSGYHTHSYDTKHVDAGCETPESTLHYCSCGVEYAQPIGPVKGHTLTEIAAEGNVLQCGCRDCEQVYALNVPEAACLRWLESALAQAFGGK